MSSCVLLVYQVVSYWCVKLCFVAVSSYVLLLCSIRDKKNTDLRQYCEAKKIKKKHLPCIIFSLLRLPMLPLYHLPH